MKCSTSAQAGKRLAWSCRLAAVLAFSSPGFANWKALGPFGGPAAFVQVDPHVSGVVIAGTDNGYLFRSSNGGETWDPLPFSHQGIATLHVLFIHPQIPNMYLAGISAVFPASSGLLRSSDGGTSWEVVPEFHDTAVRAISIFRGDPQVLVAGTSTGVFQSTDAGTTWSRISPQTNHRLQPVVSVAFDPNDRGIIFAGTPHLAWKSTTSGKTWRSIHVGMLDDSDVFSVTVDRNRRQRVFAAACSGIYRSLDGGSTWTRLLPNARASHRTYTVVQDPQYEDVMFAGLAEGMIRSQDGGETWVRIAPYTTRSIAFDLRTLGRVYIATDEAGILRSDDNGLSWQQMNRGFCNFNLAPLTVADNGTVYTSTLASAVRTLFRAVTRADEWSFEITNDGSSDDISTWPHRDGRATEPSATDFLVFPWMRGYFTMPWNAFSNEPLKTADSVVSRDHRWISPGPTSKLFELSDTDVGNYAPALHGVNISAILRLSADMLLAATSAGLRMSDDAGNSWRTVSGTLEGNTIQAICRHPHRASTLFAASHGFIYMSADFGRTWSRLSPDGLPIGSVKQIIVAAGPPDQLLALTRQHGVYILSLDSQISQVSR